MPDQAKELDPLAPTSLEIGLSALCLLHIVLIGVVLLQLLRGKTTMPHGMLGVIVLLFVPVVGPVLVLTWGGRVERHQARVYQSAA